MNRLTKSLLLLVVLILMVVPAVLAQDDASAPAIPANSIAGIAATDGRFTTLVAAATAAGLVDELSGGTWTVFAPTDDAFAKLGLNAANIGDQFTATELQDILLYHVLSGSNATAELKGKLGNITMANGQIAGLKYYDGDIYVNDDAKVIIPNILTANGYIHVVDTVVLGPWPRDAQPVVEEAASIEEPVALEEPVAGQEAEVVGATAIVPATSIAGIAMNDNRYDTFYAALDAAGLVDDLSSGTWTVFAPNDAAFRKLGLNPNNIAKQYTPEELQDILLYHILPGIYGTANLKTMLGDVTMANNQIAGLKFYKGRIWVNDDSRVNQPDIVADNGFIHGVDTVILGPWPR